MDVEPPSPCSRPGRKPPRCRPPPTEPPPGPNMYRVDGGPRYQPPPLPHSKPGRRPSMDELIKTVPPPTPGTQHFHTIERSKNIRLTEQESIDLLGPPPPVPARSPSAHRKVNPTSPGHRQVNPTSPGYPTSPKESPSDGRRLEPHTVVPPPFSPTSPQGKEEGSRTQRPRLQVPVPVQEDDDILRGHAPAPPEGYSTIPSTYKPRPSYIDPFTIDSKPPETPRKLSLQNMVPNPLSAQVSVEPPGSTGGKRPGAHLSYLQLQADDDEVDPPTQPENDYYSFLEEEPLYQVYHRDAIAREIVHQADNPRTETDAENDDYLYMDAATVQTYVTNILSQDSDYGTIADYRHSSLQDVIKLGAGTRKMWFEMPEVKASGCLRTMSAEDRKLQESLFEVITSEASYVKSLNLLVSHFYKAKVLDANSVKFSVISKQDHHVLFSNVTEVCKVSTSFLQKLEALWHTDCILDPSIMADTMRTFAQRHFDVYVTYVKNQMYQERTLKRLKETSADFDRTLEQLETDEGAQGLTLQSFLVLPMQRVTRLPLLVDSICHRMNPKQPGYDALTTCLHTMQKIVRQCNEAARQLENIEQVNNISKKLDFKVKTIPIVSSQRSLVKQGQLTHVITNSSSKLFSKKKETLHLFLFNDMILFTKKKGADQYEVREHTSRIHIHADSIQPIDVSRFCPHGVPSGCKNLIIMVLTDKDVKYVLSAESMSERMRWIEAVTPPQHVSEDEKIYEDWDCPQVQAVKKYVAKQPDELSLEESDVINVYKKMADGWYMGERIRDLEKGWFPSECTVEIQSAHLRAKNLRQHYRMLLAMATDEQS